MARREHRRGGAHSAKRKSSAKTAREGTQKGRSFSLLPGARREETDSDDQQTATDLLRPAPTDPIARSSERTAPFQPTPDPVTAIGPGAPRGQAGPDPVPPVAPLTTAADYGAPWDDPAPPTAGEPVDDDQATPGPVATEEPPDETHPETPVPADHGPPLPTPAAVDA